MNEREVPAKIAESIGEEMRSLGRCVIRIQSRDNATAGQRGRLKVSAEARNEGNRFKGMSTVMSGGGEVCLSS